MIIPIRCMTCSKVLANKYQYYIKKVEEKKKSLEKDKNENNEQLANFENFTTGEILDELKLDRMCCRRHMLTHVDLIDII